MSFDWSILLPELRALIRQWHLDALAAAHLAMTCRYEARWRDLHWRHRFSGPRHVETYVKHGLVPHGTDDMLFRTMSARCRDVGVMMLPWASVCARRPAVIRRLLGEVGGWLYEALRAMIAYHPIDGYASFADAMTRYLVENFSDEVARAILLGTLEYERQITASVLEDVIQGRLSYPSQPGDVIERWCREGRFTEVKAAIPWDVLVDSIHFDRETLWHTPDAFRQELFDRFMGLILDSNGKFDYLLLADAELTAFPSVARGKRFRAMLRSLDSPMVDPYIRRRPQLLVREGHPPPMDWIEWAVGEAEKEPRSPDATDVIDAYLERELEHLSRAIPAHRILTIRAHFNVGWHIVLLDRALAERDVAAVAWMAARPDQERPRLDKRRTNIWRMIRGHVRTYGDGPIQRWLDEQEERTR